MDTMDNSLSMLLPSELLKGLGNPQSLENLASLPRLESATEDISFDIDAHLLQKMEARIDAELGADAHNLDTFGECAGWSFQENLEANLNNEDYCQKLVGDESNCFDSLPIPPPPPVEPTVRITNLPNHLMSRAMMEVILEQANLDTFVCNFTAKPGAQRGAVTLTLSSADAAARCAQHFDGCCWDASGTRVSAKVISQGVALEPPKLAFQFSTDVPEFVPSFQYSTMEPAFLPVSMVKSRRECSALPSTCGSDVSTHDDISSLDER